MSWANNVNVSSAATGRPLLRGIIHLNAAMRGGDSAHDPCLCRTAELVSRLVSIIWAVIAEDLF